jgi:hypothetical protein
MRPSLPDGAQKCLPRIGGPPTAGPRYARPVSPIPLKDWSGSGATDQLREAVTAYNEAAAKQTTQLVRLTGALVGLTVLLFLGLLVQIGLAIWG